MRRTLPWTRLSLALVAAFALHCGTPATDSDDAAGDAHDAASDAQRDGASPEAGRSDAGGADTRAGDGGAGHEAGAGDAGSPDATAGDPDATASDPDATAGDPDAGPEDAGAGGTDAGPVDAGPSSSRLTAHPLGSGSAPQGYYEYLPPGGSNGAPLLVALHGIGENGNGSSELDRASNVGIVRLIKYDNWPAERPFVVLAPQHPGGGCPDANEIHNFLTWAVANYPVDPHRVYLTGLSCGAIGSWNYLGVYLDEIIAAFVPVAGDARNAWGAQGCALGRMPIWAFHGDADTTVLPQYETEPMASLTACTNPAPVDAHMTVYPGVGHDSWDMTYDLSAGHDVFAWMLSHTR